MHRDFKEGRHLINDAASDSHKIGQPQDFFTYWLLIIKKLSSYNLKIGL